MFSGLPTASLRLAELLAHPYRFSIPPYQRLYSWTVKEAGQLLDDLISVSGVNGSDAGEPDYFLSSIVLLTAPGPAQGDVQVHEIVDGQQRLVTLTLLAAVLRDLETNRTGDIWGRFDAMLFAAHDPTTKGDSSRLRISLRERDHSYFQSLIEVPPESCARQLAPVNVSEKNLAAVREHFIGALTQLDEQERQQLASYMCDCCHFVVIFTQDIDRAHRMFTVLNERGKPLQRNDILKAEILRQVPAELTIAAAALWDHAAELLDSDFESFFSHLRSLHGLQKVPVVAGVRRMIGDVGGAAAFLKDELLPYASAYHTMVHADNWAMPMDEQVRERLIYLSWLSGSDWVPAALLVLKRHAGDLHSTRALLLSIEQYAYLLRILRIGNGKRMSRFAAVVDAIRTGKALDRESRVFQLSRDELRTVGFNLKDLHRRNPQVCKALLLRLNGIITGSLGALPLANVTVEHVLPQRPAANSNWRKLFPDSEVREASTECLGNLILVSAKQNDRAGNHDFAAKLAIYRTPEPGFPILDITRDVTEAQSWRPETIREREARLLALVARSLGVDQSALGLPQTAGASSRTPMSEMRRPHELPTS